MPTILNDRNRRLALQMGRASGIRASSGALDQVSEQLRVERAKVRELERQNAVLRRDLEAARLALIRRFRARAEPFGKTPLASSWL